MSLAWDTYSSVHYTPLFYWLEALSFTLLGPSKVSARLVSLAAFALLGLLCLASGRRLRDDRNLWIGVIAYACLVVSPFEVRGPERWSFAGLSFIASLLGELVGSWFLVGILLATWVVAARHWRDRRQRVLVLLVVVQFVLAELSPDKTVRYMVVVLPPLGLLAGYWIVEAVQRWSKRYRPLPVVAGLALALTFTAHEAALIRDLQPFTDTTASALLEWVDGQLRRNGPALILSSGEVTYPQPGLLDWHLVTESRLMPAIGANQVFHWTYGAWFAGPLADQLSRIGLGDLGRRWAERARSRELAAGQTRTLYLDHHDDNLRPQTSAELTDVLGGAIEASGLENVIVLVLEQEQRRYPGSFYDAAPRELGFQVASGEIFPEAQVRVLVYHRQAQP